MTATNVWQMWEHYSSIRNLDGPHNGLPQVQERALSPEEEQKQKAKLVQTSYVMPWMIDAVTNSLPFFTDRQTIKRTLEECKGNINDAVSKLLDQEEGWSISSQPESSSVEREPDSDEDALNGPNKKQDRRSSRANRQQRDPDTKRALSRLAPYRQAANSNTSDDSEASSDPAQEGSVVYGDMEDVIQVKQQDDVKPETPPRPSPRIRLNPGKPPSDAHAGKTMSRKPGSARITARDKRDMKKMAQKAARKERQQAAIDGGIDPKIKAGIALRSQGVTNTPPIESGFRTLFI